MNIEDLKWMKEVSKAEVVTVYPAEVVEEHDESQPALLLPDQTDEMHTAYIRALWIFHDLLALIPRLEMCKMPSQVRKDFLAMKARVGKFMSDSWEGEE